MRPRLTPSKCQFPNNKGTTAYRKGCRCKKCKEANNIWQKDYHKRNPEKAVIYWRRRRFGIEPEDYEFLLQQQNGVCAICGKLNSNKRPLALDHCHEVNRIRGLLCDKCNTALGLFNDSIKQLRFAITYLENTRG